jgi:hypothetical protein
MKKLKKIPVNIWDDYYDDGFIPKGKIQETHAYIEEYDILDDEAKEPIIKVLYDYIMTLNLEGVIIEYDCEIYFKHLTHQKREELLEKLEKSNLKYQNIPFEFYSES